MYALLDWYIYHVVIQKRHKQIYKNNNFRENYIVTQSHVC